jgi:predicted component of type VI protein secretion system
LLRQGPLQVAAAEQVLPDGPIQEESFEDEDVPGDLVREEEELLSQESYSALK